MPKPDSNRYVIKGTRGDPSLDPDRPAKQTHIKPEIAQSALSVSLGARLAKRYGPVPNIRGDRPIPLEDAE
jgi:hypothetical protein